ncbi:hypothetical protein CPB83DRAFT_849794 [Crepidotus variabilis]|uniref:VWFA domain-containing protein n=1 Tax=Crepidotus variabilis TaxID=179855 RepID=A0A9P6ELA5_9AGAR|nr:hypothetical protein CPB83DRAFT_849794 [Crepidotus variabilis]
MVFGFGSLKRKSRVIPTPEVTEEASTSTHPAPQDGAGDTQPIQDGAGAPISSNAPKGTMSKPLDIVFLQDTTGSQSPYIDSARAAIRGICDTIISSSSMSSNDLRFGLIAFRDHPPQDRTYVTKPFDFTSDINVMQKNLASLNATGGGDGPEAQTAALAAGLEMDWKEDAVKMLVLITDAPPHGLGEVGDGFSESPDQNDPLELARQMSQKGITLFVIACEPGLSRWKHAIDFYTALSEITSGRMFPLLMADKLGEYIVGTAIETIETEKLISEFENTILEDVYDKDKKVEDVVGNLQDYIKTRGIQVNTVVVEDVYRSSDTSKKNVVSWRNAKSLGVARDKVAEVSEPRLQPQYMGSAAPSPYGSAGGGWKSRGRTASHRVSLSAEPSSAPMLYASAPGPKLKKQDLSVNQAHRIVMQSMARHSEVTSEGMVSRKSGKVIASSEYATPGYD